MKALLIALVLVSTQAFADVVKSTEIARLEATGFGTISVISYGQMSKIIAKDTKGKTIVNRLLSQFSASQISSLAQTLGSEEIITVKSAAICQIMPLPPGYPAPLFSSSVSLLTAPANENTGDLQGQPRLVLSPEGCMYSEHTLPKEDYALAAAQKLKLVLEVLVAELKK